MKSLFLLFCTLILVYNIHSDVASKYFQFIDPVPGAKYINPEATIIIKPNSLINKTSLLNLGAVKINGTLSGNCSYSAVKCKDDETIILKPLKKFRLGETVKIEFTDNIKTKSGSSVKPFSYEFCIKSSVVKINRQLSLYSELSDQELSKLPYGYYNYDMIGELPEIALNQYNNPTYGRIFISNFALNPIIPHYLLILNNDASIFYSQKIDYASFDFKVQPNGNLTYFYGGLGVFYEMDEYYDVIDSFSCGNGYATDLHELRLLNNKHALLMSYDPQHVDMSVIVPGGNPNAVVSGLIVQELDDNHNVVFQWRSWDHFQITDATHENLLDSSIDYVHGNAIDLDNDGNLLISSRHMDEITKINRTTGNIIWRLGGKNNQFLFPNDPDTFNHQHGIRRLKNGNIILFDNGNFHVPSYSRALEYHLDEVNKVATMVWQYRNNPEIYGLAMGFAQRLDNGNTFIGWGFTSPSLTEVTPGGTVALEMSLPHGSFSYRAFKFDYKMNESVATYPPQSAFLGQNYPNPFNPKTTIKFGIPRISGTKGFMDVKLKVYDVLGREIAILVDKPMKPYTYNVDFDASGLATGVYFYTISVTGNNAQYYDTKKMIVVK